MKKSFYFLLSILFCFQAFADDNFDLTGQIRYRYEMVNKDFNNDTDSNNFNLLRSRLNIKYNLIKEVKVFFQLQDSRVMGKEKSTLSDGSADAFDLHQGFVEINHLFNLPLTFKLGRSEVIYGTQRFVGAVGWHNIGRSFDGGKLTFHSEIVDIDFFSYKEVEETAFSDEGDRNFYGLYSKWKLIEGLKSHFFIFLQQAKPASNLNRYTAGTLIESNIKSFNYTFEGAYQGGTIDDIDVSAFLVSAKIGFSFSNTPTKPAIFSGIDYLSGDDDTSDDKYKAFDTLYATNHKFYGFMDYFLNIPRDTDEHGLTDFYLKASLKPMKLMFLKLDYHNFTSSEDYQLNDGSNNNYIGDEIDAALSYKYSGNVAFTAGASYFIPGDIVDELIGKDNSSWFYFMTTVTF